MVPKVSVSTFNSQPVLQVKHSHNSPPEQVLQLELHGSHFEFVGVTFLNCPMGQVSTHSGQSIEQIILGDWVKNKSF